MSKEQIEETLKIYAHSLDRRKVDLYKTVIDENCIIEGPGFIYEGIDACVGTLSMLDENFRMTMHRLHQSLITVEGDTAFGETYCVADHLHKDEDVIQVWGIRYQDKWRCVDGQWLFTHRKLDVEYLEHRPVTFLG